MSVLLIGLSDPIARELIPRLVAQQDEVRAIEDRDDRADEWRELRAHVAHGPRDDVDLIVGAAQNVRTIVVGQRAFAEMSVILSAAAAARDVDRVVVCAGRIDPVVADAVQDAPVDHVILRLPRGRAFGRARLTTDAIAAAIDAADDLAGNPRLDLDLAAPEAWAALRLPSP